MYSIASLFQKKKFFKVSTNPLLKKVHKILSALLSSSIERNEWPGLISEITQLSACGKSGNGKLKT